MIYYLTRISGSTKFCQLPTIILTAKLYYVSELPSIYIGKFKHNKGLADYPYVDVWVDLDTIRGLIACCNCHFENRVIHIRGFFRCQKHMHICQRKLVVKLQMVEYQLEPACGPTIVTSWIRYKNPLQVKVRKLFWSMVHKRNPNDSQFNDNLQRSCGFTNKVEEIWNKIQVGFLNYSSCS